MRRRGATRLLAAGFALLAYGCGPKINPGGTGAVDNGNDAGATTATNANQAANLLAAAGCTSASVGYAAKASAVIKSNCNACHGAQQPLLTSYALARTGFVSGGGLEAISSSPPTMPVGTTMSAADKCTLLNWAAGNYAQ